MDDEGYQIRVKHQHYKTAYDKMRTEKNSLVSMSVSVKERSGEKKSSKHQQNPLLWNVKDKKNIFFDNIYASIRHRCASICVQIQGKIGVSALPKSYIDP